MKKTKKYLNTKFTPEIYRSAIDLWKQKLPPKAKISEPEISIDFGTERWKYNVLSEFFTDYLKCFSYSSFYQTCYNDEFFYTLGIETRLYSNFTEVSISFPTRGEIEEIFFIFDSNAELCKLPIEQAIVEAEKPTIFIGHGRSKQWRDLKDHLVDKHGFQIEAYETGARAGHSIRDILDDMLSKSSIAFLIHTGEDELSDGKLSARQNVIHETGLFQGKLGFSRGIVILEEGTNEFSNLHGIQQIRYSRNNIKETFGEVLATIKREFQL